MNNFQISRALNSDPVTKRYFDGIVARDEFKNPKKRPSFVIANTDVSSGPGKHWVSFFFPKHGKPEFFDSLGRTPSYYKFKTKTKFKSNKKTLQASDSRVCGHYALFYALQRSRGIPMDLILYSEGP